MRRQGVICIAGSQDKASGGIQQGKIALKKQLKPCWNVFDIDDSWLLAEIAEEALAGQTPIRPVGDRGDCGLHCPGVKNQTFCVGIPAAQGMAGAGEQALIVQPLNGLALPAYLWTQQRPDGVW